MSKASFVRNVVNTCLHIGKDDKVVIFTWRHMIDLAEAFAIECRRAGAQTHTEFGTDEMFYEQVMNLPLEQIKASDPFAIALLNVATANIFISGPEDPERLKDVPPERWIEMSKADKPYYEKLLEKKVRTAQITLGYVTPQRARTYGFDYDEWKRNINDAMDVDYNEVKRLGEKLGSLLEKAREVRITAANGTNLTFKLQDRPVHVYDGVVDEKDIEKGAVFFTLPSGAIQLAPVEDSANGSIVSEIPEANVGVLVHDLKWVFKDGRVTSFEGGKNADIVKAQWEKASGDKDRLGWLTFGINPRMKPGFLHNQLVLGAVTVGIGDNREVGGSNKSDFIGHLTVLSATVELDGKTIIRQGKLAL